MTPQPTERPMAEVIAEGMRLLEELDSASARAAEAEHEHHDDDDCAPFGCRRCERYFGAVVEIENAVARVQHLILGHGPKLLALAQKGLEAEETVDDPIYRPPRRRLRPDATPEEGDDR